MNIRPATADDVRDFMGDGFPLSVRAFVAEDDGLVLAVAGIAIMRSQVRAFANERPGLKRYPMTAMRMAIKVKALMDETAAPVFCKADPTLPNSKAFLERLGFKPYIGDTYVWSKE